MTPKDPEFVRLLARPDALYCPLQGTLRVELVPCLHQFRIIAWLAGDEDDATKSTSTKVSFQRRQNAQLNEVTSIFGKSRLQTRCPAAVWLHCNSTPGDLTVTHFVRPSYGREGASGVHSIV